MLGSGDRVRLLRRKLRPMVNEEGRVRGCGALLVSCASEKHAVAAEPLGPTAASSDVTPHGARPGCNRACPQLLVRRGSQGFWRGRNRGDSAISTHVTRTVLVSGCVSVATRGPETLRKGTKRARFGTE